ETKAHIDRLSGKMAEMQAQAAAAKQPSLEESLKRAGASDEQIASVKKALDIPAPSLADFDDQAAWNKAAGAYADEFGSVIGADEKTVTSMKNILSSLPAGEPEKSAPRSSADCAAQLVKAGMEPAAAARLVAVLDEDIPDDPKELLNYASRVERAAGFPEGSVRGRIENVQKKTDELGVTNDIWPGGSPLKAAEPGAAPQSSDEVINKVIEEAAQPPEPLPLTQENLPEILAAGGSIAGAKLDGFDLAGFDFSGLDLKGTSFVKAKLDGARFDGASLAGAAFAAASLSGASFVGADLSGADLSSAAAADADFSEAVMTGADISGASLAGATLSKVRAERLKAAGADLSEARVSFSDMSGADFSGAQLRKMDFHESRADGANFRKASLGGSTFCWGSSARKADFTKAELDGANWTDSDAGGADFTCVSARGASFTGCELSSSRWSGADAAGGDFSRSRLEGASMRGVNLFGGSMREARAFGADLSGSNLFGADLCRMFTNEATELRGADVGRTVIEARKGR
ncbi:MAG TPA: pentapeptide repeat-containing protein, partial [Candidatus Caccocola faecipullorum]|nr:pentapeptide repeat-containing protein [Candidatus Caccocola faecipullorum]